MYSLLYLGALRESTQLKASDYDALIHISIFSHIPHIFIHTYLGALRDSTQLTASDYDAFIHISIFPHIFIHTYI